MSMCAVRCVEPMSKNIKVYFENSCGERRPIGEVHTSDESWRIIHDFCKERKFKIPYVRSWCTPEGEKWYDVGSHTEFFIEVESDCSGDT